MDGKRILVTGGAGFIGSHLVEALLRRGDHIIVFDDFSYGSLDNLSLAAKNKRLKIIRGDVRDLESLRSAAKHVDELFHLAVLNLRFALENPLLAHKVNAMGTLNACIVVRENRNIKKFVFTSSGEAYGNAQYLPIDEKHPLNVTNPYAADKVAGEMYIRAFHECYGIPFIILRLFNTYGPRAQETGYSEVIPRFVERVSSGLPPIIFGDGTQTRNFIYIDDLVEGILSAAQCYELDCDVVNLASAKEISINSLANIVLKLFGKDGDIEPVHTNPRPGDLRRSVASISKANRLFGFKTKVPMEVGLRKYIEWYLQRGPF